MAHGLQHSSGLSCLREHQCLQIILVQLCSSEQFRLVPLSSKRDKTGDRCILVQHLQDKSELPSLGSNPGLGDFKTYHMATYMENEFWGLSIWGVRRVVLLQSNCTQRTQIIGSFDLNIFKFITQWEVLHSSNSFFFSGRRNRKQVCLHIFLQQSRQKQVSSKFIFQKL